MDRLLWLEICDQPILRKSASVLLGKLDLDDVAHTDKLKVYAQNSLPVELKKASENNQVYLKVPRLIATPNTRSPAPSKNYPPTRCYAPSAMLKKDQCKIEI
ncbi:hypothetical protein PHYBLDRAFT_66238 [Phycomyces blakesleeanus NRRL 1555(-)]|uniref:Uncharacterized protein n=1 Tax=Phycomyces blakesleeanus (strain ATCC 8743b / DSM 1359 / FGSC 10004 / NBRC 33097 / NRRL 1555) TaxID=763407 RepID=A0A167L3V4_PHYB8|nr:hypothetical protein PHYBLDRAFT_66238 [Phycomyces blakesleeanus NRRL 1555(-)]OAD69537.1 hypothetical protein PHYBLDRAFT_66238 [Phycomyces blakesleeanus NRRL 1555(-)]|eukprot:XP_018287577.1 hypothetical protein PHYBLDRAFT_66238 [Phycomyces blakesleeanus NRRL 1555(-)]